MGITGSRHRHKSDGKRSHSPVQFPPTKRQPLPQPVHAPQRELCLHVTKLVPPTCEALVTRSFYVPHEVHHVVVGKNGERIHTLQDTHGVQIHVPRVSEKGDDVVAVSGTHAAVEKCRNALEDLLALPVGTVPLNVVTLGVPRKYYGRLIGKGGETLRFIMSENHVLIEVPHNDSPGDVRVHGHDADCLKTKKRIEELIKETVMVLSSAAGDIPSYPLPPSYNLATSRPIRRSLFFPDHLEAGVDCGLTTMGIFLKFLDSTRISCDVCVFAITDDRISQRLLDAHRYRGVKVRVITDDEQVTACGADAQKLQDAGIEVRTDSLPHHMHNKFCILDGQVLMNGSFNWTRSASEHNNENIMITNDKAFVVEFNAYFETLWSEFAPGKER